MGFVHVKTAIQNPTQQGPARDVELLVDTGALFSMVPAAVLQSLGISPTEKMDFETANGQVMYRDLGYAWFRIDGRQALSPVIFGGDQDAAVLGVVTLETLRMEVDPVRKEIRPIRAKMY